MPLTPTQTVCKQQSFEFQGLQRRKIITDFSAGFLSTDGGVLLLRETARPMGIFQKLAACFNDSRNQEFVEHPLETLLQQRILGLALGYEDLNDHDQLRHDPLLAAACGQADLTGARRKNTLDQGVPLAGKSTLNRLELSATGCASRYKKLQADPRKIQDLILQQGVAAIPRKSQIIILDFDATDSLIHGHQEGRFFHGYYEAYCYLPLYCFCETSPSGLNCALQIAMARTAHCPRSKPSRKPFALVSERMSPFSLAVGKTSAPGWMSLAVG